MMILKKSGALILTAVLGLTALTGCGSKDGTAEPDQKTLVVAMELAYPPFETKDSSGNPTGISVDLAKAFGEYAGYEVKIENISWDGLIPSLQTGKADMVISSMTITEERKKTVDFSDPYANACLAILANKDAGISSIEDLNESGRKVAVKTGSTGYLYAQNHLQNAEIVALSDESACVTEVSQGKADGFLYDQLTVYRNWKNHEDTTQAVFIPFQDAEQWGIAVQKGNAGLLRELNSFIAEYRTEGGFGRLSEKYLGEEQKTFKELGFTWFFDFD
ncbi:MAG: transporter substrate-binding domain-containing protein [Lachnospiraceae bacterium]|nr:transporter substrate-binding domain-containing protein [Lachnospiraceae bacterium]